MNYNKNRDSWVPGYQRYQIALFKKTPFLVFAIFGAVSLLLVRKSLQYAFIERPHFMRVLKSPHSIEAELVECHTEVTSNNHGINYYSVDYRWKGSDGTTRTTVGQVVPNLHVFAMICGGLPTKLRILTSDTEPDLRPVIEASKEVVAEEDNGAIFILALLAMVTGTFLSLRAK
jgi:hypothetical protein